MTMAQVHAAPNGRKVALVTGGGKGIGAAIVRRLSRDGFAVMVNYRRSAEAAIALVESLRSDGVEVAGIQGDVGDPAQAGAIVTATVEAFGRLDLIVNNAGVATFAPVGELTPAALEREFAVNVGGIVWTAQAALPHLASGGSIVNLSSVVAEGGPPGAALYAASKAAVSTLTRTLATELGPKGIRTRSPRAPSARTCTPATWRRSSWTEPPWGGSPNPRISPGSSARWRARAWAGSPARP
jgi:3-oxoacyl-[acyl-carrier protein] reductase